MQSFFTRLSFLLGFLLCTQLQFAEATHLRIEGQDKLSTRIEGENVVISGSYEVSNKGDEKAYEVFPAFTVGSWVWAGEPKTVDMNGVASWLIEETVPLEKLRCRSGSNCTEEQLPAKGTTIFLGPIRIKNGSGSPARILALLPE